MHKFKIGQTVRFSTGGISRAFAGNYRIVALLPEEHGETQYRIQSAAGPQQRVAWESQLSKVDFS